MHAESRPWTLTMPSDPCRLGMARGFVESVCEAAGLDRGATDAVVLAFHEAASNVIRHAHGGNPDASIQVRCFLHADALEIHLIDEGRPFDLAAVPHLDPAELRIGGRGVFLMRTLLDELTCQPHGERGNTLRMVKRCVPAAPSNRPA
jgi:anti-sigma regulatory factor (Ser/Thr protein kinase)